MQAQSNEPDFLRVQSVDVAALTNDLYAKARALGDRNWRIDGLAPDGTVVYHGDVIGMWVGKAGSAPVDIRLTAGKVAWRDGMLLMLVGRSVFEITP